MSAINLKGIPHPPLGRAAPRSAISSPATSNVHCDPATGPTPCIQAGTIPGFVITSKKRVATLRNAVTSGEADVPKFDVTTWYGMYAPRDTPESHRVDALVDALQKALKDPPVVNRFAELSMAPVEQERAAPAVLAALLKSEIDRWDRIINRQAFSFNGTRSDG